MIGPRNFQVIQRDKRYLYFSKKRLFRQGKVMIKLDDRGAFRAIDFCRCGEVGKEKIAVGR